MIDALIPATVQVLTRNNIAGIGRCLDSLTHFAEVIVQDGFSTDGTRELVARYPNVRLIDQNKAYLNGEGRITDFAAMRNESIRAARFDWIFVVDGDEGIRPDMEKEIASLVSVNVPGVYEAFRRFEVNGEKVMYCSGYPALQIRFFHRSLVDGYAKAVHERLVLKPNVQKKLLETELPVPLPPAKDLEAKNHRYLLMEVKRQGVMPWKRWFKWVFLRNLRSIAGLTVLTIWMYILPRKGKRMPIVYEWQYIVHCFLTIVYTFPPRVARLKKKEALSI